MLPAIHSRQYFSYFCSMRLLLTIMAVCITGQLHAQIPVRIAYNYSDNTGKYTLTLAESIDSIAADNDTLHYIIKGTCLQNGVKKWELNDHRLSADEETTIWFWTKFCELKDIDGDGIVEPIIVYGTSGYNGINDGRIKILTYYKGIKTAIRHQNATLDGDRFTDIDASFYTLPAALQQHLKGLMKTLEDKNFAIFATNYELKMKKKATHIE